MNLPSRASMGITAPSSKGSELDQPDQFNSCGTLSMSYVGLGAADKSNQGVETGRCGYFFCTQRGRRNVTDAGRVRSPLLGRTTATLLGSCFNSSSSTNGFSSVATVLVLEMPSP